jgi:membrane glycosyltransferase
MTTDRAAPTPGFVEAVVDPALNALICATGATRRARMREERRGLVRLALANGPDALADPQKMRLLDDPDALAELHSTVWTSADVHAGWREAVRAVPARSNGEASELPLALGLA